MNRTCSLDGCTAKHYARGWCRNHYMRWWTTGTTPTRLGRPTGPDHTLWTGADASYSTAHARVAYRRGKATAATCQRCGGQAKDWAYDHDDPDERTEVWCGRAVSYSADPGHYIPLCRPCHTRFDQHAEVS